MATGYTIPVRQGRITEFADFTMLCARAFGATILMRDDDLEKPIPQRFEPSDYHIKALAKAKEDLQSLYNLTNAEADAEAEKLYREQQAHYQEQIAEREQARSRYQALLDAAEKWTPPTSEHHGVKAFMIEQLRTSLDFDCNPEWPKEPARLTGSEWRAKRVEGLKRDIEYHNTKNVEEINRTEGRNKWLDDLRASVKAA